MSNDEEINLKLIGNNQEDLKIISAYLQDSIVNVRDIVFLKKNRTFIMMVNRFMWEDVERGLFRKNKRIRCAVRFEEVIDVKSKNINQKNKNKPLECLAIKCNLFADETFRIKIFFSGDSIITIKAEVIGIILNDIGKSWDVKSIPKHKI